MVRGQDLGRLGLETLPEGWVGARGWVEQETQKRPFLVSQAVKEAVGDLYLQTCKFLLI